MTHLDLFSGIGGFAIAVDEVFPGSEHIFCDNDNFCQAVLKKHWPQSKIYGDIRALHADGFDTNSDSDGCASRKEEINSAKTNEQTFNNSKKYYGKIDIITGGFPCQPFSQAGKRQGTNDDRHLWPEMLRVIQEFKPTWVIAENVRGLLTLQQGVVFEQVCADLEASGYEVQPLIIPAVAVNAPHRRDRVWFTAYRKDERSRGSASEKCGVSERKLVEEKSERSAVRSEDKGLLSDTSNAIGQRSQRVRNEQNCPGQTRLQDSQKFGWDSNWIEVAGYFLRMDDGVSSWLDRFIYEEIITEKDYAFIKNRTKDLQILWKRVQSEKTQERMGGILKIFEKKILLSFLLGIQEKSIKKNEQMESEKIDSHKKLRKMWDNAGFRSSSQGRKLYEQQAGELVSIMPELPYDIAQFISKIWYELMGAYNAMYAQPVELGGLKLSKAGHRNAQLKAYGNAIVPAVAIEILKAIKKSL